MKFETALQDATHNPEQVNFFQLLRALENYLTELTHHDMLSVAGTALMQLTDIYVIRAERLLATWEENYWLPESEPIITDDMLMGFLRQSMSLNLDDILEDSGYFSRTESASEDDLDESVAGTVEKDALLDVIDDIEVTQQALSIAHDENVSEWTETIYQWMHDRQQGASLLDLVSALSTTNTNMTLIKVWLGLILGGYVLEQRGEFYDIATIWVQPQ